MRWGCFPAGPNQYALNVSNRQIDDHDPKKGYSDAFGN